MIRRLVLRLQVGWVEGRFKLRRCLTLCWIRVHAVPRHLLRIPHLSFPINCANVIPLDSLKYFAAPH